MPKALRTLWRIITAPFRFIFRFIRNYFRWISKTATNIKNFFKEEPEDSPLADTLEKAGRHPEELLGHLDALRKHLTRAGIFFFITTAVSLVYARQILAFLSRPLPEGMKSLIAIDVTEPLSTLMKISLLSGFALALPYIVFELYRFIAPGISTRARIFTLLSIPIVVIFFLGGMAFAYYIMLPPAMNFLLGILGIPTNVRPANYIGLVTGILFWIGLTFEFPLVIFIIASLGFITAKTLAKHWRIAIIIIAVVAAVVTPTIDPVNMSIVMAPLILLYFFSIGLALIAERGRK